jgi:hypothetical protein
LSDEFDDPDPYENSEDPRRFEPSPSEQRQFKTGERRGQGRPRGARGKRNIVEQLLLEKFEVREAGEIKRLTALEIITKVVRNHSLDSDRAFAAIQDLVERCSPQSREPRHILGVFPEKLTAEMWAAKYGQRES